MNVVTLIGNLASEVETRAAGEQTVASFLLAVNRRGEGADFIRVSTWNGTADACAKYLGKGNRVGVEGRLRSRRWEAEDGTTRTAVEVVANRVEFLTSPAAKNPTGIVEAETSTPEPAEDDIPF